jgi:hypothetical protein
LFYLFFGLHERLDFLLQLPTIELVDFDEGGELLSKSRPFRLLILQKFELCINVIYLLSILGLEGMQEGDLGGESGVQFVKNLGLGEAEVAIEFGNGLHR